MYPKPMSKALEVHVLIQCAVQCTKPASLILAVYA